MRSHTRAVVTATLILSMAGGIVAATGKPPKRRAKPPTWTDKEKSIFFTDAREKLVGERPSPGGKVPPTTPEQSAETPVESGSPLGSGEFAWSRVIETDVIEDEIKSIQRQMAKTITTPAAFKGGGYKQARIQLSTLAVMFGVIAEYDQDVRWKQQASGIRDLVARAGFNAKVGTDGSYNEAKLRRDDMEALVQGNQLQVTKGADKSDWSKVAGRPPLMSRMEQAFQEKITAWTSSGGEFSKNSEELLHEAQILATIAELIQREGFEFADDDGYLEFARAVRDGSLEIADAVKQKKYDPARKAAAAIGQACTGCHEGYRS